MRLRLGLWFFLWLPVWCLAAPLPDNQVFQLQFNPFDANTLKLDWTIKEGYFLYKDRIWIDNPHSNYLRIGMIHYPDAETKTTKEGKNLLIYRNRLTLAIPVLANSGGESDIVVHYQGCSDAGFCYPPQTRSIQLSFDQDHALQQAHAAFNPSTPTVTPPALSAPTPVRHSTAAIQTLLLTAHPVWILLSFFGFGLLLAFTPCVLPMVPVLSTIIIGHGKAISTRKAFLLSLTYVLSMSLTYGCIGAVIALVGANLQVLLQSPWVIGGFSGVFVLLALSMFDVYTFRLPLAWQDRLAAVTRSHQGGQYLNAALMGSMSILVLSPCVTPPLIGALTYIADSGSAVMGLAALFFLGLGMGAPLLLLGASAGKLLPKAGKWMNTVKYIFGMLLLGLAIHLLERLLSPLITMVLWSLLFIVCGFGLRPFFTTPQGTSILRQAIGCMLIIFGGFILYGASAGHTNPWQPLSSHTQAQLLASRMVVTTVAEAQRILNEATQVQKPVVLDFYATWCESCQSIEQQILQAPELQEYANRIVMIQVDLSKNNSDSQALLQYFQVVAPPTFLFYNRSGEAIPDLQIVGMTDVETLVNYINTALRE